MPKYQIEARADITVTPIDDGMDIGPPPLRTVPNADTDALKARLRTLMALADREIDGDLFALVIHLEEAKDVAEKLEEASARDGAKGEGADEIDDEDPTSDD